MARDAGPRAVPAIEVEVAAGLPDRQAVVRLTLAQGATVAQAVARSGILERFPELSADTLDHAVHGVRVTPGRVLASGDRVEILRPLQVDPRESRRRRARRSR